MVVIGLVSPFATIPQVIKVFATHTEHAAGQSLITWAVYTVIALLWVAYGIIRRELPLIIGNTLGKCAEVREHQHQDQQFSQDSSRAGPNDRHSV